MEELPRDPAPKADALPGDEAETGRDWAGLLRFVLDAATLIWQGPSSELPRAVVLSFGEELAATCLPLGDQGELRYYGGGRLAVLHYGTGMAQLRRSPAATGGLTRLDRLVGDLLFSLVRR